MSSTSDNSQNQIKVAETQLEDGKKGTIWNRSYIYWSWLLLCFCTGPVASMSRTYVPATIQSVATLIGKSKAGGKCARIGNDCYVKFGTGHVHSTSYVLYIKAIATAIEGLFALLLLGIADYSNYRKILLIGSILIYGCFALPFAGLDHADYSHLTGLLALYVLLQITDSTYQLLEGSYIPLFMRAAGDSAMIEPGSNAEEVRKLIVLKRGSTVSVMGIFLGNCGGITALLIGIIISYGRGGPAVDGYHNFLLAITIAGAVTIVSSIAASFYIPSVHGKPKPEGEFLLFLTIKRISKLISNIRRYPNAFLYCISWVIWNVSYSNFLSVFVLLFRSTLGIGNSDPEYTIYTFMSYICASLGSLAWMALYPRLNLNIKTWGFGFFFFQIFSNFWGCLGISEKTAVGFKHRWEFWVFEVLYSATGSSLRSLNRTVYSTLLPEGDEAQYFGLEIFLGIATGWIGNLVNASIQDRTGNDRYPFLPNVFLATIACVLYAFCDLNKGMKDAEKIISETQSTNYSSTSDIEQESYQQDNQNGKN